MTGRFGSVDDIQPAAKLKIPRESTIYHLGEKSGERRDQLLAPERFAQNRSVRTCGIDESRIAGLRQKRMSRSASHLARGKLVPTSRRTSSTAATGSDFSASSIPSLRRPAGPKTTTPACSSVALSSRAIRGSSSTTKISLPQREPGKSTWSPFPEAVLALCRVGAWQVCSERGFQRHVGRSIAAAIATANPANGLMPPKKPPSLADPTSSKARRVQTR
jgi:hypothetical protein